MINNNENNCCHINDSLDELDDNRSNRGKKFWKIIRPLIILISWILGIALILFLLGLWIWMIISDGKIIADPFFLFSWPFNKESIEE